jgi:hypothetical protein
MYSDVAASRPPSPAGSSEKEVALPPNQSAGAGNRPSDFVRKPIFTSVMYNEGNYTPSESSDSDIDKNTLEWTTVQRKRRGSKHCTSKERLSPRDKDVSADVDPVLAEAEKSLTNAQKEKIALRQKKVNPPELEPYDEGPSGSKGKNVDPRNWGNVQLNEEEADVEAQQAALDSLRARKKQSKRGQRDLPPHLNQAIAPTEPERHKNSARPSQRASKTPVIQVPKNARPPESRPEAQIAPKSFLGITLQKVGKGTRRNYAEPLPSDPSS